jgi:hypothetical protein
MGSFHASRLSFMRVLLRRLKHEGWRFDRPIWRIDALGVGVATYRAIGPERVYTLVAFAHDLPDELRSDRVIAEAWDATFTLFDGEPDEADIDRLSRNVPLQEAGRVSESELVLARANRSVRLFAHVIDSLVGGRQPDRAQVEAVGYLMRTTAVYGSGKFGAADRDIWANRREFWGSFQPEMLAVWLIRSFTLDIVEHLAEARAQANGGKAARIDPALKRRFGVGNSTGLGMAPFLVSHPALIHAWINARETALARVRALPVVEPVAREQFECLLARATENARTWSRTLNWSMILPTACPPTRRRRFRLTEQWQSPGCARSCRKSMAGRWKPTSRPGSPGRGSAMSRRRNWSRALASASRNPSSRTNNPWRRVAMPPFCMTR